MVALGFREDADGHLVLSMVRKERGEFGMRNELGVWKKTVAVPPFDPYRSRVETTLDI